MKYYTGEGLEYLQSKVKPRQTEEFHAGYLYGRRLKRRLLIERILRWLGVIS